MAEAVEGSGYGVGSVSLAFGSMFAFLGGCGLVDRDDYDVVDATEKMLLCTQKHRQLTRCNHK